MFADAPVAGLVPGSELILQALDAVVNAAHAFGVAHQSPEELRPLAVALVAKELRAPNHIAELMRAMHTERGHARYNDWFSIKLLLRGAGALSNDVPRLPDDPALLGPDANYDMWSLYGRVLFALAFCMHTRIDMMPFCGADGYGWVDEHTMIRYSAVGALLVLCW